MDDYESVERYTITKALYILQCISSILRILLETFPIGKIKALRIKNVNFFHVEEDDIEDVDEYFGS